MPRLIWSRAGLRDISRLHAFIAPHNPDAARRAAIAIRSGVRLLNDHPHIGRLIEGMPPDFRTWPIGFGSAGYVATYGFDIDTIIILAVRHSREVGT